MDTYRQNIRVPREQTDAYLAEHYLAEHQGSHNWLADVLIFVFTVCLGFGILGLSFWPMLMHPLVVGFVSGMVATCLLSGCLVIWIFYRSRP